MRVYQISYKKSSGGIDMKLHYNYDGSICMILNWRGSVVQRTFFAKREYESFLFGLNLTK